MSRSTDALGANAPADGRWGLQGADGGPAVPTLTARFGEARVEIDLDTAPT